MLKVNNFGNITEFIVARTVLGRPLYYNHFYYIDGLLIDCGPSHVGSEVIKSLRQFPLQQVAITHQHEDHTGNCRLIQEEFKIPIYAHPDTVKTMADPPYIQLYRRVMWGNPPVAEASKIPELIKTANLQFRVFHTPGHSPDHISFFEPLNRWLFCGDLYLGENLNSFMAGENIVDHLNSLHKMISLKPAFLFCGLKGPLDNATERLTRKYNRWLELCTQASELYLAGLSRKNILKEVFGGEALFFYISQSNWGRRFMLESIIDNITFFTSKQRRPGREHKKK